MEGNEIENDPKTKELSDAAKARSLDINDDGKLVAVGFRNGGVKIISTANWKILNEIKIAKEWISDVKFSPSKKFLAYASHDNKVYIHTVHDMKKKFQLDKSTSFINQFDWSVNADAIKTNDASYEILYYQVSDANASQDTSGATNYKDEEWATWTCTLGWPVQGIWEPGFDGTDINSAS